MVLCFARSFGSLCQVMAVLLLLRYYCNERLLLSITSFLCNCIISKITC